MIGLDTNVLVRYLTMDDKKQSKLAADAIDSAAKAGKLLYINLIVLVELNWVLARAYEFDKPTIIQTLEVLFSTAEFQIERKQLAWKALQTFRTNKCDFSDALIAAINHSIDCEYTLTFDKAASLLSTIKLLKVT